MSLVLQHEPVVDWEAGTRLCNAGYSAINEQRRNASLHDLESDGLMALDAGQHALFLAQIHKTFRTPEVLLQQGESEVIWHGRGKLEIPLESTIQEQLVDLSSPSHPHERGTLLNPDAVRMGIGTKILYSREGLYLILVCRIRTH